MLLVSLAKVSCRGSVLADNDPAAAARSASFLTGIGIIWTFFIKSGNVLKDRL